MKRASQQRLLAKREIFAAPAAIGVLTLVGLGAAMTGEGLPDVVAWACLGLPVGAVVWAIRTRRR